MITKYLPYYRIITSSNYSNLILKCRSLTSSNSSNKKSFSTLKTNQSVLFRQNILPSTYLTNLFHKSSVIFNHKHIDKDYELITIKFPNPKNILNTVYSAVANELKTTSPINAHFKVVSRKKFQEWTCTYSIKWPEELKISATAPTKSEASKKAAVKILYMLDKEGKILDNGQPIIYDKETFNKITKKTFLPLVLDEKVESKLKLICDIYESKIKDKIDVSSYENYVGTQKSEVNVENNVIENWSIVNQRNKDISTYYAKESVDLPIQEHKKEIEALLDNNRVVIIRGQPGCGKSTRVPQYLLEHWIKTEGLKPVRIICTQPRRLAAISLAERVANERQERVGDIIGYQVRLKSNFNPQNGRILYCTTGILLRQLQSDASLQNCTHVIIDEAHERDVNTDLLMNLLRHAINLNPNLKIVVMSATMDTNLFKNYFNNAPVINVAGFTYPVKQNFLDDIPLSLNRTENISDVSPMVIYDDVAKVIRWIHKTKPEGAILCFLPGWDEISKVKFSLERMLERNLTSILTLHSKLSDEEQHRIFSHPPKGVRKIVLGTNIAETSVTIDDIIYVVDTGIHKETRFDSEKGITCLGNHWISKSSTNQRKGRAGRVQPGECFHLFTKNKYEKLPQFSVPEILRVSLDKIVLDAKVYSHNMNAIDFFNKLPCPPEVTTVLKAIDELTDLELLDNNENVTPLGKILSEFQLPPKLSRSMVMSVIYKCVTPIVDIATIFSSGTEIFSTSLVDKPSIKATKEKLCKTSDHIALMLVFEEWLRYIQNEDYDKANRFCFDNNIVQYKMNTLKRLEEIHFDYLDNFLKKCMNLSDKCSKNEEIIKGVLLSGVGNILTNRKWDIVKGRLKAANVYVTKRKHKATITPESVNSKKTSYKSPFFVYINETKSLLRNSMLVRETSLINPLTLLLFKNGELISKSLREDTQEIKNGAILIFRGTKLKFLLTENQANLVLMCKEAMKNIEKYLIHQLTEEGKKNEIIQENWDKILDILEETLKSEEKVQLKY